MIRRALLALAALAIAATFAPPALAGQPVSLLVNPVDAGGQVTLGEIFDDAGAARDVVVAERTGPSVVLDAAAVGAIARRYGLDWANPQGLRRIIVRAAPGGLALAGARRNLEVLTYARDLATGEVVQPQDLIWAKAAAAPFDAPRDVDAVVGLAARRPLREGDAVNAHDVTAPIVIRAGDAVVVTWSDGGITLTLQGKAIGNAAVGETVVVLNTVSKKSIEAVASGPDEALVGPGAAQLKSEHTQIALR
jgi:flagella basal body P-ring formation protein FlgA